ncbi:MAG: glycine--tRNA ligase subunit beta [Thainema sp.]
MATFLLEVGTEELPAAFVSDAIAQWQSRIEPSLAEQFLTPESVEIYGTPRRLVALIKGLPEQQPDREEEAKGPPAQAAFKDGKPTKAAEGFARSRGATVEDLEIRSTDKGDFVFVTQKINGRRTADILIELVPDWILKLDGKRLMRWGDGDVRFSRPVRWLVALMDDAVLPIVIENGSERVTSDCISHGHRVLHPEPVRVPAADQYVETLRSAYVEVDPNRRRETIQQQTEAVAKELKGVASISPSLLEEVTQLVEWPTAIAGQFSEAFLELPSEVAITEMESHQRYFPVLKQADASELLPYFITVANGDPTKSEIISRGNERVIQARLSDGKFFFDADRKQPLEHYVAQLETVTFQEDLGSMLAKVERIEAVAERIAHQLQQSSRISAQDRADILRAAHLCKADLVTQMVGEFPELQGVMGEKYARHSDESEAVAMAIFEHYLPRGAGDKLPDTLAGQVVGIADRLDSLVSIFSLGQIPSGSSDPFALRRAATAVVNIVWHADLPINLNELLGQVIADFKTQVSGGTEAETLRSQLQSFFLQRIQTLLQDERGVDYDLVNAVLGEDDPEYTERALIDLLDVRNRALFLQEIRTNGVLDVIYETVNRASKLALKGDLDTQTLDPSAVIDPALFQQPTEQAFYDILVKLVPETQAAQAERDYHRLVEGLKQAAPIVSEFFDGEQSVLVMADDAAVRQNRLNLLGLLRNHARVLADFGAIVKQ